MDGISQVFISFLFYLSLEMCLGIRKFTVGLFSGKIVFLTPLGSYALRILLNETDKSNKLILM